jgi:uncharacterized PurR-regulated membrane protein YhhQ (DUF165 family)
MHTADSREGAGANNKDGRERAEVVMAAAKNYRYYDFVMVAFVTVLICSNLIGPAKIAQIETPWLAWLHPGLATLSFGAGVLFFPISYVFGDILTEVYGYSRARK